MADTYTNPVHDRSCPDPFVLKHLGVYWAYCTGTASDGHRFGVLRSEDLVTWHDVGGALDPLPGSHPCYWAPEVTYHDGRFLMYYSVGDEATMTIRVAVADRPEGPFVDAGRALTSETFAIDPHVFIDDDGGWYLFYAADFLEHSHVGTGTVVDRMSDPFTLEGAPRPVARARFDWQVYDPARAEKGGVRWHTVEGPFVLKRKGRYYEMFSGGNWQNVSYGVAYATSRHLLAPDEWAQHIDGVALPPILRTVPDLVIGPGHNSVVRGPANRELFCVYHRWNMASGERVLAIDRLEWVGERLVVLGPTTSPQPAPLRPAASGFGGGGAPSGAWASAGGAWTVRDGSCEVDAAGGMLSHPAPHGGFLCEVSARAHGAGREGRYGLRLLRDGESLGELAIVLGAAARIEMSGPVAPRPDPPSVGEPAALDPGAFQPMRLDVNGSRVSASLGGRAVGSGALAAAPTHVALFAAGTAAAFAGFELTDGWEDRFDDEAPPLEVGRWSELAPGGAWEVRDGVLVGRAPSGEASVVREAPDGGYELVVTLRARPADEAGGVGIYPAVGADGGGPLLLIGRGGGGWTLQVRREATANAVPLPPDFDAAEFQQLRVCVGGGRAVVRWGAEPLIETEVPGRAARVGLYVRHGSASFDLVRVTATPGLAACGLPAALIPGNA